MTNHLINNEPQELLGELRIQPCISRELAHPRDLSLFSAGVSRRQARVGFVAPHSLSHFEPLCQYMDKGSIDIVDA